MDLKSGWKTSEFWLSLIAIILGVLVTSDIIPSDHIAMKIAGMAVSVLAALGYQVARSSVKKNGGGK